MNEAYVEWMVKRKTPGYAILVRAAVIFLILIGVILSAALPFGFIFLFLAVGVAYVVFPMLKVEYEYLVVNEQLSIDKIMGQTRRKKQWEGTLDEIEIIAPVGSTKLKDAERQNQKVLDYSSHMPNAKVYGMIHSKDGENVKVLFEPNEKIIKHLWLRAPRKVIQQ